MKPTPKIDFGGAQDCHGDVARLELGGTELERALAERTALVRGVKAAGYQWVTLDLAGFRSGSLNVVLRGATMRRHGRMFAGDWSAPEARAKRKAH